MIETQWTTFTWATVGILLMLTLAFRGPKLAVLAILPTMLAVGLVLGPDGLAGREAGHRHGPGGERGAGAVGRRHLPLPAPVPPPAAVVRFEEALFSSYAVTGPGVLLSSLAVALGFSVLRFSEFVPFATFGLMVAIATAGSSLGNIVLLPACLSLAHRFATGGKADPVEAEAAGS